MITARGQHCVFIMVFILQGCISSAEVATYNEILLSLHYKPWQNLLLLIKYVLLYLKWFLNVKATCESQICCFGVSQTGLDLYVEIFIRQGLNYLCCFIIHNLLSHWLEASMVVVNTTRQNDLIRRVGSALGVELASLHAVAVWYSNPPPTRWVSWKESMFRGNDQQQELHRDRGHHNHCPTSGAGQSPVLIHPCLQWTYWVLKPDTFHFNKDYIHNVVLTGD